MAKTMALIENCVVSNVLWCSDRTEQTDTLIDLADRPVGIGYTFLDGKFYRDGEEVLTPLEAALEELADARSALEMLGVNVDE